MRKPSRLPISPDVLSFQCGRCSPLYNDKPFRSGNKVHAFNCKPCQCHGHASSCHYDASMDPFPLEYNRGGGGVCDDCQHHTTGNPKSGVAGSACGVMGVYLWMQGILNYDTVILIRNVLLCN